MKNKLLTMILAGITAFSFTACGGEEDKVKLVDISLTEEEYAFVMQKGNDALTSDINEFLADKQADGTFDEIMDKYFKGTGEKVGYPVETGAVVNDDDTFVVVTNCPFEPFEYLGDDGKIYGLDIEIAGLYAQSKGLDLVIKNINFDSIFTEISTGYADIGMAGITASEDRMELYNFSTPYYNASQKLIVAMDNEDFKDCETVADVEAVLASLDGKTIGYQTGTTGGMYINGDADWGYDGFPNLGSKGYQSAQDAVMDLINGNIYAVIVDNAPASAIVKAVNS